jgi:hypothetical protein
MKKNPTKWHQLLGSLLKELLSPMNILVQPDVKVMTNPPEADILLLRRDSPKWTAEQMSCLPDGIRNSTCSHFLIEFKYTESINEEAFLQVLGYYTFYKRSHKISDNEIQSVLMSAKTPRAGTLTKFGYVRTKHKGIYCSKYLLFKKILFIDLNELSNEPHNAWVKCFASQKREKQKAFVQLKTGLTGMTLSLECFLTGLWKCWFNDTGETDMSIALTPEDVTKIGKMWGKSYLSLLTPEERLAGLKPEERLAGLKLAEIEDYLNQLKSQKNRK